MRQQPLSDATTTASLSGAGYGSILGALAGILVKKPGLRDILKKTLMGGAAGGALAGGSTLAGSLELGRPREDEPNPYARRGVAGGATLGALGGAGAGVLAARGKIPLPKSEDWLSEYFRTLVRHPTRGNLLKAAALGAAGLGTLGAYNAGYEGMQLDAMGREME